MNALERPLHGVADAMAWLIESRTVRALHLHVDAALYEAVLPLVVAFEHHAKNRRPFLLFDQDFVDSEQGWPARLVHLIAEERRWLASIAAEGLHPTLPPPRRPVAAPTTPVRFAIALDVRLRGQGEPFDGMVLVVAPRRVEDAARAVRDLNGMVGVPDLAAARWVFIEPGTALLPTVTALGAAGMARRVALDGQAFLDEQRARAERAAASDARAPALAQKGAAWPRGIVPPARKGAVPPITTTIQVGDVQVPAPDVAHQLRTSMLRASLAVQANDWPTAVREQAAARDTARAAGMEREARVLSLALGGILCGAGHLPRASTAFREVRDEAVRARAFGIAAQASMALGTLSSTSGAHEDAARSYTDAVGYARDGEQGVLAIECARLAGEAHLKLRNARAAEAAWRGALELARALPQNEAQTSSAPQVVEQLAAHLRAIGRGVEAAAVSRELTALAPPAAHTAKV